MKNVLMTLVVTLSSVSSFAGTRQSVVVDNSRGASQDIVEISISGGKGSQAEKLYNSLSKVEEQPDDAMGGRHGTAKQARAIDCSVENDKHVKNAYSCIIKISTSGESLEPWK